VGGNFRFSVSSLKKAAAKKTGIKSANSRLRQGYGGLAREAPKSKYKKLEENSANEIAEKGSYIPDETPNRTPAWWRFIEHGGAVEFGSLVVNSQRLSGGLAVDSGNAATGIDRHFVDAVTRCSEHAANRGRQASASEQDQDTS
jgi:hypothetical protein